METVTDRPPEGTEPGTDPVSYAGPSLEVAPSPRPAPDTWLDALKFYATGRTAAGLRDQASWPGWAEALAYIDGVTPDRERAWIHATADRVALLAASPLTREEAYRVAGLDDILGPYEGYALLSAA